MAAEPQRSNQPLVNGQNEDGSSSMGKADKDTVGGEQNQEHQQFENQRPRPPPQLNWPRQQRPQEFDRRGINPIPPNRLPLQGVIRRGSPWSLLKNKLPDQAPIRPGIEHQILRMQNPEERPRTTESNGSMRPPSVGPPPIGMARPPSGPLSRPPSQESSRDSFGPSPDPRIASPRSPYLQRADSRTSSPGVPTMPRQTPDPRARPPSVASTGRSLDDDEDVMGTSSPQSRQGSARPLPSPVGARPANAPIRPPSRTPPQSPAPQSGPPLRSPQSGRQSSLSSLNEQGEPRPADSSRPPTATPIVSRPPSSRTESSTPYSETPGLDIAEGRLPGPTPLPNGDVKSEKAPAVTINEPEETPKRPTDFGPPIADKDAASTNGEVKQTQNVDSSSKKETVVNGSQESPKKSPTKTAAPKKLGTVGTPVRSPNKVSPKTPDTPGTAEKKNSPEIVKHTEPTLQEYQAVHEDIRTTDQTLHDGSPYNEHEWQQHVNEHEEYQYRENYESQENKPTEQYYEQEYIQQHSNTGEGDPTYTKQPLKQNKPRVRIQEPDKPTAKYARPPSRGQPIPPTPKVSDSRSRQKYEIDKQSQKKPDYDLTSSSKINTSSEEDGVTPTSQSKMEERLFNKEKQVKKGNEKIPDTKTLKHMNVYDDKIQDANDRLEQGTGKFNREKPQTEIKANSRDESTRKIEEFKLPEDNLVGHADSNEFKSENKVNFQKSPVFENQGGKTISPVKNTEWSAQRNTITLQHKHKTLSHEGSLEIPETPTKIKLPMNKIQVGAAPSPNLKSVRSKIGSLENAKHKPGGGNVKIENRKINFNAGPKIAAKNENYMPKGGDKKIQQVKLQWNAKSKIGSLENATHKPGGGDKKIESVKLDFKEKAKPKVGSKDNIKHTPGGGTVKVLGLKKKKSNINHN